MSDFREEVVALAVSTTQNSSLFDIVRIRYSLFPSGFDTRPDALAPFVTDEPAPPPFAVQRALLARVKYKRSPTSVKPDASAIVKAQASLRGSVGGVTGIVAILTAVAEGNLAATGAIKVLIEIYGLTEEVDKAIDGEGLDKN